MLDEDAPAPTFTLPGTVDGDVRPFSLSEHVGEEIVVLCFYPVDFGPLATDELWLRDVDLLSLREDVTVFGVGGDSAHSHRAFAEAFNLDLPLLSDSGGEVAERYDVLHEDADGHSRLPRRAVFVLGPDGRVAYAWSTADSTELPPLSAVRDAVASVRDDASALDRYRAAHETHRRGSSRFDVARAALEDESWTAAVDAFETASDAFDRATDGFVATARLADEDAIAAAGTLGERTATRLAQAARWFVAAAEHENDGNAALARECREDAIASRRAATELDDLPAPDDLPTEE